MKKTILTTITILFFILVGYLFYQRISTIDFQEVKDGFSHIRYSVVFLAVALVMSNYLILSSFDYFAFKHFGPHFMHFPRVIFSAFICYAFNLNLGALVGGLGFRYRIYSRWGVSTKKVPNIILSSISANWSGYVLLLGLIFLIRPEGLKVLSFMPEWSMITFGIIALAVISTYLYLCLIGYHGRVKKLDYQFPKFSMALLQLGLSSLQWIGLSLILFLFLHELGTSMQFEEVMLTLLMASIAGVITHIPAGVGVIETLFLRMGEESEASKILVALICFRTVYYLLPLIIAIPSYFILEIYQKSRLKAGTHPGGYYVK